ncbi:hypothetical protein SBRY_40195 [Actinacidiphila bryophytorum]|uniref:Uncharacterized protein n=1 Tax=Actinacidiphila bryophytorum TaxID=1436133 RepID=A0A9W4H2F1_9ACTN|nr:hypothetical protein SBRY_40195 [Actinacidiphila bryophytorum]
MDGRQHLPRHRRGDLLGEPPLLHRKGTRAGHRGPRRALPPPLRPQRRLSRQPLRAPWAAPPEQGGAARHVSPAPSVSGVRGGAARRRRTARQHPEGNDEEQRIHPGHDHDVRDARRPAPRAGPHRGHRRPHGHRPAGGPALRPRLADVQGLPARPPRRGGRHPVACDTGRRRGQARRERPPRRHGGGARRHRPRPCRRGRRHRLRRAGHRCADGDREPPGRGSERAPDARGGPGPGGRGRLRDTGGAAAVRRGARQSDRTGHAALPAVAAGGCGRGGHRGGAAPAARTGARRLPRRVGAGLRRPGPLADRGGLTWNGRRRPARTRRKPSVYGPHRHLIGWSRACGSTSRAAAGPAAARVGSRESAATSCGGQCLRPAPSAHAGGTLLPVGAVRARAPACALTAARDRPRRPGRRRAARSSRPAACPPPPSRAARRCWLCRCRPPHC